MYYRRSRFFFQIIFSQLAVGFLILITGLAIVYYSQGYRLNFKTFKVMKTGVIFLASVPRDAGVIINNVLQKRSTPFAKNVSPGYYDLAIRKEGYVQWENSVKVQPELVYQYDEVVLFKEKVEILALLDQGKINLLLAPTDILAVNANDDLTFSNHEIWVGETLVGRFSKNIYKAIWFPDMEHILYQEEDQIRVIEKSGSNDTLLVTLSEAKPTLFAIGGRGTELYFTDRGQNWVAKIR